MLESKRAEELVKESKRGGSRESGRVGRESERAEERGRQRTNNCNTTV